PSWQERLRLRWMKGVQAKVDGDHDMALREFRACEGFLGEGQGMAVVLPHCVVHRRLDAEVIRGAISDIELTGTSEAARCDFKRAVSLLHLSPANNTSQTNTSSSDSSSGNTCALCAEGNDPAPSGGGRGLVSG
ncbi:unnamed protein product, partial [Discosporangium mesarthrocarpum]